MDTAEPPDAVPGSFESDATRRRKDEAELVAALLRGDEEAYAALIDDLYAPMQRLAMGHVRDGDLADDVIQETWLAVVEGIDRFEGRASLRTWIFRILMNLARKKSAKEGRFVTLEDAGEGSLVVAGHARANGSRPTARVRSMQRWGDRQNPEDWVLAREVNARIEAAIEALPRNQRAVITLRDVEGWTSKEVCELLEISAANQRVLLHRARQTVREALRPYLSAQDDDAQGPNLQ